MFGNTGLKRQMMRLSDSYSASPSIGDKGTNTTRNRSLKFPLLTTGTTEMHPKLRIAKSQLKRENIVNIRNNLYCSSEFIPRLECPFGYVKRKDGTH